MQLCRLNAIFNTQKTQSDQLTAKACFLSLSACFREKLKTEITVVHPKALSVVFHLCCRNRVETQGHRE